MTASAGSGERRTALATVGAVLVLALVVVGLNLWGRSSGSPAAEVATGVAGDPSVATTAAPGAPAVPAVPPVPPVPTDPAEADYDDPEQYAAVTAATPEEVAQATLAERPDVTPQPSRRRSRDLASAAEAIARQGVSYSFTVLSFNILGSQHTVPGGSSPGYGPGVSRARAAAGLIADKGASIVGLQEVQADQLAVLSAASGGTADFWPGTSLGGVGIPQSVMWDNRVWRPTYTSSVTVPFVGTTRPQPIVRLQHLETGREIYVMNVHNSPNDRQAERDQAVAIEVAAIQELRRDGIPVIVVGDFNERDRIFCSLTGQTDLLAANGGSNVGGSCRPPPAMRIDWIFASPDAQLSAYLSDDSPRVGAITDHTVISATVLVP